MSTQLHPLHAHRHTLVQHWSETDGRRILEKLTCKCGAGVYPHINSPSGVACKATDVYCRYWD